MVRIRRKGVAIVESSKGILVVAGRRKIFALPGGGTNRGESRRSAAMRELREETGLKTNSVEYLFGYKGKVWTDHKKRKVRNHAKVFLLKAYGRLRSRKEVKHVAWYKQGSKLRVSRNTKKLIEKYLEMKGKI